MKTFSILKKAIFIFVFIGILMNGQVFSDYRARYDNFDENDDEALEFVFSYIKEAKGVKNYRELSQAYRDAVYFSKEKKLIYADSTIWAAKLSGDSDIIGNAYLTKGSIYYFTLRKYQRALDEYLRAWGHLKNSDDSYLYYKNLYHIGVVKSYLGYYEEAFKIFAKCCLYYKTQDISPSQPNLQYNRKRGYLNSLNQMSICLILLSRYGEASELISEGMKQSANDKDIDLERSYFYKLRAILCYIEKKDSEATSDFNTALAAIEKANDFTNASVIYFLKGKILLRNEKEDESICYLKKVDSIFVQHQFVLPAVRESYELLINYYKAHKDGGKELYYTKQLLAFDKILAADFKYLSTRIHREYDTRDLRESKKRLEHSSQYGYFIGVLSFISLLVIFGFSYRRLLGNGGNDSMVIQVVKEENKRDSRENNPSILSKLPEQLIDEILGKLSHMEERKFYLEKGLTQNQLAKSLKTNTAYLSAIINMYKGCNFNSYVNRLRIEHAKEMLINDNEWRKYSIDTISKECGFSNRSNFSRFFMEMTSMGPIEFIQKINKSKQ